VAEDTILVEAFMRVRVVLPVGTFVFVTSHTGKIRSPLS